MSKWNETPDWHEIAGAVCEIVKPNPKCRNARYVIADELWGAYNAGRAYERRKRRQAKAALRRKDSKPRHRLQSGRTGSVHSKRLATRRTTK